MAMKQHTGYGVYKLFIALKLHFFSEKYNFFEYNGKSKTSREAYDNRNDRFFFEKLAELYDPKTILDFFVANLLEGRRYVTELMDDNSKDIMVKYQKRRESLGYHFDNETEAMTFDNDLFKTLDDQYPPILLLFLQKRISIETLVILDDFVRFFDKFDKYYADDVIWPKVSLMARKYKPFLKYDKEKFKSILKGKLE
jgi:hypothetical protein